MEVSRAYICKECLHCLRPIRNSQRRTLATAAPASDTHRRYTPPFASANSNASNDTRQSSPGLLTLQPQTLHSYTATIAPTLPQLAYATTFFASSTPPQLLWTTGHFRSLPSSTHPEVCFLGRSNVGKSSLLNALFNRPRARSAHVSKKPGRTRTMNAFGVGGLAQTVGPDTPAWKAMGRGGVVVLDMPGYGAGSREEWGAEILKYVVQRRQLRRTFVLVDAEHGLKGSDLEILAFLAERGVSHQVVLSKVDKLLFPAAKAPGAEKLSRNLLALRGVYEDVRAKLGTEDGRASRTLGDVLCCSAEKEIQSLGSGRGKLGIDAVRWAVLTAAGLDCDEHGKKRQFAQYNVADDDDEDTT